MNTTLRNVDHYLDIFTAFGKQAAGYDTGWLRRLREDAFAFFCQTGFPTTHDEDWRFTNISAIARTPFALAGETARLSDADLAGWKLEGAASQLVFVDGRFVRSLSSVGSLPAGITVSGLKDEIVKGSALIPKHLGRYLNLQRDSFCALNTAFGEDGAFIHIASGMSLQKPIHLLFVSTGAETPTMLQPRNLFLIGREAQAQIIEEYVSLGAGTVLCNSVTELVADESSTVEHFMIERSHTNAFSVSTLRIQQERAANVTSHSVLLGGGIVRNNAHPVLAGEGSECLINGLFIGNERQHLDNYMYVEHVCAHSSSRQFYNGILDGAAHGVFHGRIVVHKDAQRTDAKQTNRNLLLSDDAQIDTKPQLEIYADDVKCTHGATIGQIEENALFYLRSRGLDEISARRLLLAAFANECMDRMSHGIARRHVETLIHARLLSIALAPEAQSGTESSRFEKSWEEVG